MKHALNIFGFTVVVTLFYWYVGQQVPQKETHPPEEIDLSGELTTEQMVEAGGEIFYGGKGTCATCHTVGESGSHRFPDLGGIGAVAATRRAGLSDVEYLAESLYDPNAYIVDGFAAGMPVIDNPPIDLNDREILTVIAFLQSLGGTPTVTIDTELAWQTGDEAEAPAAQTSTAASASGEKPDGPAVFTKYICNTCHSIDNPASLVGPSLYDVGKRLSKAELYESILDPDATIAEGYFAGVMSATVNPDQFTPGELKALVDYLASMKGN